MGPILHSDLIINNIKLITMKNFINSIKQLFTIPNDWYRYYEG